MGNELNEQEKKVIEQYAGFPEWKRLSYTKAHETEFIVTMHYLHKYLTPGAKIADVGAGGGVYTKALADEGHNVDAVELTPEYVKHMKEEFARNEHIRVFEGNAKNLHFLNDNEYDLVLVMGPIYSIKDFQMLCKRNSFHFRRIQMRTTDFRPVHNICAFSLVKRRKIEYNNLFTLQGGF